MQKLQCEICGSNDLVKTGEYFVCEHCGTKYTKEDLKDMINVKVDVEVNDKHWEEAKEQANAEAEQLDYEITLLEEEFIPLHKKYLEISGELNNIEGQLDMGKYVGLMILLVGCLSTSFIFLGIGAVLCLGARALFEQKIKAKREAAKKAEEISNQKRNELREKITLIPEKFWTDIDVVRDYYKNWGSTNQRDLLNHLEEHFRKPDVIEHTRTIVVEK